MRDGMRAGSSDARRHTASHGAARSDRLPRDGLHPTGAKSGRIIYYAVSRLPGEGADGVAARHSHPVEPAAVRPTPADRFRSSIL
jgi:hypothetical protein